MTKKQVESKEGGAVEVSSEGAGFEGERELPEAERLELFRRPAPAGRSRESRIVLDAEGRFWRDGEPFVHQKLSEAFHRWIGRHPEDGRYVLYNGLDWSYFTVEDAPFLVTSLFSPGEGGTGELLRLRLSDGSEEPLVPESLEAAESGALYVQVKADHRDGPFRAKLTRHAQHELGAYLEEVDGQLVLQVSGRRAMLPALLSG